MENKEIAQLANSNTTKEAMNCTDSILAADSIVVAIRFITRILFCDPKSIFSQIRIRLRTHLGTQIRPDPAPAGFEKIKSGATLQITFLHSRLDEELQLAQYIRLN